MREQCSVDGCSRFVAARGLSSRHYLVARRTGRIPLGLNRTERVLAFIDQCLSASTDQCIEPSFKSRSDYPSFTWNGVGYKVGWLVLERSVGPRGEGEEMRHLCGNRRCCNPRHLAWGTHLENMQDWKKHGCAGDRTGASNSNYRHGRSMRW